VHDVAEFGSSQTISHSSRMIAAGGPRTPGLGGEAGTGCSGDQQMREAVEWTWRQTAHSSDQPFHTLDRAAETGARNGTQAQTTARKVISRASIASPAPVTGQAQVAPQGKHAMISPPDRSMQPPTE